MSKIEFAAVIAYLGAGVGKELSNESMDVYYDLLGDLPVEALQCAAKKVLLEHPWATFPSPAELRRAASETIQGRVSEITPADAWRIAWEAAGRIDLDIRGSSDRACKDVPPSIVEAMMAFGLPALCYGHEPVTVVRAQFMKIFEQLAARDRRLALLPAKLQLEIEQIPKRIAGSTVEVAMIGKMPD